jgi:hypothetical protein
MMARDMSSTVTTTTVSTVTAASTFESLGQTLTAVAIVLLLAVLIAREISSSARGDLGRRVARGLDIALMPLTVTFAVVVWLNSGAFLG